MKKGLIAALVSVAALGVSGCVLVGPGNTQLKTRSGAVIGEMHAQSGGLNGYLVTFYPGITQAVRAFHDGRIPLDDGHSPAHRWNCGAVAPSERDACTLRWLRTFDDTAEWNRATAPEEAGDFHSAITGLPHPTADCVAVHIDTPGWGDDENWTYRHGSDSSCQP